MTDFTNDFWPWFIVVITVVSLVAIGFLALSGAGGKKAAGAKPETMGHVWDQDLTEYNNPLPRWWLNLFYLTLFFAALYLVLYPGLGGFAGLLHWTQIGQYKEEMAQAERTFGPLYKKYLNQDLKAVARDPQALKMGKRLFANYCATCHGADAGGALGFPNLTDEDWLYGGEPEIIKTSILQGRAGVMPPWEEVLGEADLTNVTAFVRRLSGNTVDAAAANKGAAVFAQNCAACHGADAKGNPTLGAPNLSDTTWLYGGSERRIRESIAKGRQGRMPPHKEFLGEAKAHLLAAYVYSRSAAQVPERP